MLATITVADCELNYRQAQSWAGAKLRETELPHVPNGSKVILIPDLCTVPVEHYRQRLCGLSLYMQVSGDHEWQVVVATGDHDTGGVRVRAWMSLLEKVARRLDSTANDCRVVSWEHVQSVLADAVQLRPTRRDFGPGTHQGQTSRAEYAPQSHREQVLHLVGRHPCLSVEQLAQLLGTTTVRIRRVEDALVDRGWSRRIDPADIPADAIDLGRNDVVTLGLVEITSIGRRQLAEWLGLDATTAARYHGLIGTGRSDAGRRWRLLRTLAHTLGTNSVFVALTVASAAVRSVGGSDRLAEWRGAAACERKYCKPDGYGCYVRNGQAHGFFLEYDRGTESTRTYAAKFRAYYSYRDSRQADRDYNAFPTLLFVTTQPRAEQRIGDAARRAWFIRGTEPLAVLITTTSRITSDRQAILGRIWRTPGQIGATAGDERQYWLADGPPGTLVGVRHISLPPPRLERSTTGGQREVTSRPFANAAEMYESRGGPLHVQTRAGGPAMAGMSDKANRRSRWETPQAPA